jgi:beta-galactosidase
MPEKLRIFRDYSGKELTFYRIEVVDKDGNLCPRAALPIFLKTTGTLQILGVDNGLQTSTERFQADRITTFNGKALVVVRGKGTLTVQTYDMPAVDIE